MAHIKPLLPAQKLKALGANLCMLHDQKTVSAAAYHPVLRALWLSAPLPLLAAVFATCLWLLLPPDQVMRVLREGGAIEGLTEKMYLLLAAALWLSPRQPGEWKTTLALSILLAAAGAREMDWHKAFTGFSVLKVSFYLHDRPLVTKLIAFSIVGTVIAAAIYLLRRYALALWHRFWRLEPVAWSIAIFFTTMVITKVLDRSINVLDQDFGIPSSASVLALVSALEETVEMALPLIAALARWQYLKLKPME